MGWKMKNHTTLGFAILLVIVLISGCTSQNNNQGNGNTNFQIKSNAFTDENDIPQNYTANGQNISPPLSWSGTPANTKSFTVICEDLDASSFTHWIIFNIPESVNQVTEAIPNQGTLSNGAKQGTNNFNRIGYSGPSPPSGTHRYMFKIYALDIMLNLDSGATKDQVKSVMQNHILGQAQIIGKYGV